MLGTLFKALSFYWMFQAAKKGPRGIAAYAVRRAIRKAANRQIREIR